MLQHASLQQPGFIAWCFSKCFVVAYINLLEWALSEYALASGALRAEAAVIAVLIRALSATCIPALLKSNLINSIIFACPCSELKSNAKCWSGAIVGAQEDSIGWMA